MSTSLRLTDRKRAAILEAAIAEFRANGFESTSMDKIAARAEVSKRTVYNHFPSKDELFADMLLHLWQCSAAAAGLPYRDDQPLRPQLEALLYQKLALLNDQNFIDLARIGIAAALHSPERAQAIVARMSEKEDGATAWIRAAAAAGRLQVPDVELASQLLQGQVKAIAFWPQLTMGQPPLADAARRPVVETIAAMFLALYAKRTA